jgi:hypothetical protein
MFPSAVLFVLFAAGCWLYCLADAALTPAAEFRRLGKPAWIAAIAVTFILGAIAWVIARRSWRTRSRRRTPDDRPERVEWDAPDARRDPSLPMAAPEGPLAAEAFALHPAGQGNGKPGRTRPIGPDDDPEFLRMLDRLISGTSDSGELPAFAPGRQPPGRRPVIS